MFIISIFLFRWRIWSVSVLKSWINACFEVNNADLIFFTAALGGLLGLGVGFSFISLIEIMYFFGARLFFNRRSRPRVYHNINLGRTRRIVPLNQNFFQGTSVSIIHRNPNLNRFDRMNWMKAYSTFHAYNSTWHQTPTEEFNLGRFNS